MKYIDIELVELSGFVAMLTALHLPFKGEIKSPCAFIYEPSDEDKTLTYRSALGISARDYNLINALILRGDEHAKCVRALTVYLKITAPRHWWHEMKEYNIGTMSLGSSSTMHTEAKGLSGDELVKLKDSLPEGTPMTQVREFNYQTLRRIYYQRKDHRLPHWREFCEFIETLPFSEFITERL